MDENHGTSSSGDHENYFNFLKFEKNKETIARDLTGDEFTECEKKAVYVRSREEHKPWFAHAVDYTFLFSKHSKFRSRFRSPREPIFKLENFEMDCKYPHKKNYFK